MQSNAARIGLGIVAVVAAVVLFVVLSGNSDDGDGSTTTVATGTTATAPEILTIIVKDGEPVGGVQKLTFSKGERVRFTVGTDGGEEIHVHGYDIEKAVPADGGTVAFDFPAKLDGVFEVELHLHEGEVQIAELTVEP